MCTSGISVISALLCIDQLETRGYSWAWETRPGPAQMVDRVEDCIFSPNVGPGQASGLHNTQLIGDLIGPGFFRSLGRVNAWPSSQTESGSGLDSQLWAF
jgi:hypothetical protein